MGSIIGAKRLCERAGEPTLQVTIAACGAERHGHGVVPMFACLLQAMCAIELSGLNVTADTYVRGPLAGWVAADTYVKRRPGESSNKAPFHTYI